MSTLELAPYAVSVLNTRGRLYHEESPKFRSEFQRDRDRIVHSTAFRRLEYKTQVFVNHEGDLFRTRLTHTLEVAQIARVIARALRLNEDLAEAVALAHDLGHTPFGHAGQDALDACMRDSGGFEHNLQSLRIVDRLEERYAEFAGLNLSYETREGIVKHCSQENVPGLGDLAERFVKRLRPSLEAQICNLADEIAYNNHDVDDGLRSGLISVEQMDSVALFSRHHSEVRRDYPALSGRRLIHETIRRMINAQICDLIEVTQANLARFGPCTLDDVRACPALVAFSPEMHASQVELKRFLHANLYRHYQVLRMTAKAHRVIDALYRAFSEDRRLLPPQYRDEGDDQKQQARRIADYIAGMTDRYAMKEYRRLYTVDEV